jgi:hypothetical protein
MVGMDGEVVELEACEWLPPGRLKLLENPSVRTETRQSFRNVLHRNGWKRNHLVR